MFFYVSAPVNPRFPHTILSVAVLISNFLLIKFYIGHSLIKLSIYKILYLIIFVFFQGTYSAYYNATEMLHHVLGSKYFYGTFVTKSYVLSKKGNIFCSVSTSTFRKLQSLCLYDSGTRLRKGYNNKNILLISDFYLYGQ